MILISFKRDDSRTIVTVAGRLDEDHLAELREQCSAFQTELAFDLSELRGADRAAIHWLSKRVQRGDEILRASPYIKLLLERDKQGSDSPTASGGRSNGEEGE